MPTRASNIARVMLSGIEDAQKAYVEISGGEWVWTGAEYWITVHVAKSLRTMGKNYYVTGERNIKEVMSDSGRTPGRPYNHIRGGKRFDLVLWEGDIPIAPIEVKCQNDNVKLLIGDLDRVAAAILQSNMKLGALGYYFSMRAGTRKNAQQRVDGYISRVKEQALCTFEDKFEIRHCYSSYGDTDNAWVAGCLLIERRW